MDLLQNPVRPMTAPSIRIGGMTTGEGQREAVFVDALVTR
jgi:hypothetical protein